jgi:ribosomal protein S18 acetylase RimI-like enzyme
LASSAQPVPPVRQATDGDLGHPHGITGVYVRAYAQPPWNEQNDPARSEEYLRWVMRHPETYCLVTTHAVSDGSGSAAPMPVTSRTLPPTFPLPLGEGKGEGSAAPNDQITGFILAGARPYEAFVGDWERMADKPAEGWPVIPGKLGYIWEIAVEPSIQRRGLGSALLGDAIERLRGAGIERLILRSNDRAEAAVALYRRFGFRRLPLNERLDPQAGPWVLDLA